MNEYVDIFPHEKSRLDNPDMALLLNSLVDEIMIEGETPLFLQFLGDLESNNKLDAKSSISNAAGIYQFTPDEVDTTKRGAIRNAGFDPEYINAIPNDPTKWTLEQSNIMALANLFPAVIKGHRGLVEELLSKSFIDDYDMNAWLRLYDDVWHTKMDVTRYSDEIEENKKRIIEKYSK